MPQEKNNIKKAAVDFESYFLQIMFREMRKTSGEKSQAEGIFQDMLDEEYAKSSAKAGGIGLAAMILKQIH